MNLLETEPETSSETVQPDPVVLNDWPRLLQGIKAGDHAAMERLYREFQHGIRFQLVRHLGPDEIDDRVHETFLIAVDALQRGELREPHRLLSFIRTIVRRQLGSYIEQETKRRQLTDLAEAELRPDPKVDLERDAIHRELCEVVDGALRRMSPKDGQVLRRFYMDDQPVDDICSTMRLSKAQFRLLKSRAKARLADTARRRINAAGFSVRYLGTAVRDRF